MISFLPVTYANVTLTSGTSLYLATPNTTMVLGDTIEVVSSSTFNTYQIFVVNDPPVWITDFPYNYTDSTGQINITSPADNTYETMYYQNSTAYPFNILGTTGYLPTAPDFTDGNLTFTVANFTNGNTYTNISCPLMGEPTAITQQGVGSANYTWNQATGLLVINASHSSSETIEIEWLLWLEGWRYRKAITVDGVQGAGENYTVQIDLYNSIGADSDNNVYLSGNAQADFGDVRFTDNDQVTQLDYLLWDYETGLARFWVKLLDDLDSDVTFYVYYGADTAQITTSDGENTFPRFFDDFDDYTVGNTPDGTKWSSVGTDVDDTITVQQDPDNASLVAFRIIENDDGTQTSLYANFTLYDASILPNFTFYTRLRPDNDNDDFYYYVYDTPGTIYQYSRWDNDKWQYYLAGSPNSYSPTLNHNNDEWYEMAIKNVNGSNYHAITNIQTGTAYTGSQANQPLTTNIKQMRFYPRVNDDQTVYVGGTGNYSRYMFARYSVQTEPSVLATSDEQQRFYLTTASSPVGASVTGSGWYVSGTSVPITAPATYSNTPFYLWSSSNTSLVIGDISSNETTVYLGWNGTVTALYRNETAPANIRVRLFNYTSQDAWDTGTLGLSTQVIYNNETTTETANMFNLTVTETWFPTLLVTVGNNEYKQYFHTYRPSDNSGNQTFYLYHTQDNDLTNENFSQYIIEFNDLLHIYRNGIFRMFDAELEIASGIIDASYKFPAYLIERRYYDFEAEDSNGENLQSGYSLYADPISYIMYVALGGVPRITQTLAITDYVTWSVGWDNAIANIVFNYLDSRNETSSLEITIYQSDENQTSWATLLYQQYTYDGNVTVQVGANSSRQHYVEIDVSNDDFGSWSQLKVVFPTTARYPVSITIPSGLLGLDQVIARSDAWVVVISAFLVIALAMVFGAFASGIGSVVVAGIGTFFGYIGWLPVSWEIIAVVWIIAVLNLILRRERGQG